jgi:hypothetical protein
MAHSEARQARLAVLKRELTELGAQHDLAMSAFKFDEARELQQRIAVLERELAELAAALPTPAPPPFGVPVPVAIRRRHPMLRRR